MPGHHQVTRNSFIAKQTVLLERVNTPQRKYWAIVMLEI